MRGALIWDSASIAREFASNIACLVFHSGLFDYFVYMIIIRCRTFHPVNDTPILSSNIGRLFEPLERAILHHSCFAA